jgi:hypothetical protein
MKNTLFLFLISISILTSCEKNNPEEPFDPFKGKGSAQLNGQYWEAEVYGYNFINNSFSIDLQKRDQEGIVREKLGFYRIPFLVQRNTLLRSTFSPAPTFPTSDYATVLADGDVAGEWYILTPDSSAHYLEITTLDSSTNEIEGHFEATLIIHPNRGKLFPSSPDTLAFRSGQFKVKVKK